MNRPLVRAATLALGAALTVPALATPSYADGYLPDGCAGSVAYVCTGWSQPPSGSTITLAEVPVGLTLPSVAVFPGATIGGQQVGGVVVPVGGQTVPGFTWSTGPTQPVRTGLVLPVDVCVFVTCLAAGTPVTVPGLPLPVVPITVPSTAVPSQEVGVPVVGTVPVETVEPVSSPAVDDEVVVVRLYTVRAEDVVEDVVDTYHARSPDLDVVGDAACTAAGGETSHGVDRDYCRNGEHAELVGVANAAYGMRPRLRDLV